MQITLTAKVKINVSEEQNNLLLNTMHAYRDACNFVSDYIFKIRELSIYKIQDSLYSNLREQFGLKSQMAISVIKTVVAKYKTILKNEKKWIKPEFKKPYYELVWNRDYSLKKNIFSVNTLSGRLKLTFNNTAMEKYFNKEYKFGTATLIFKHGKYYLHIPVTSEVPNVLDTNFKQIVGIDRGVNFVIATHDSLGKSKFVSGKQIKHKRAQYKKTRQELQRRQTPSARRRLKSIGNRENRWMQDVNHQVSKSLVNNYPEDTLFVLEDLTGIRGVTEKVKLKYRYVMVSWSYYDLEQKIKYKAAQKGSKVINVDPHYTSQRCPICGYIEKTNRNKKNHTFCCKKCSYKSNDDRIGAMNLYLKGIEYLANTLVPVQ